MISAALRPRVAAARAAVLLSALAVNLAIFCLAPWLIGDEQRRSPSFPPVRLTYFAMEPEPPLPEAPPQPPPPPDIPKTKLPTPRATSLPSPQPVVAHKAQPFLWPPSLSSGPALSGAPPLPSGPYMGKPGRSPMLAVRIPPPYPFSARRRGIQGWVKVRFLVDAQGKVGSVEVLRAEPPGVFEESVRNTLPRWRFSPGLREGRAEPVWVETTIRFKLE